MTEVEQQEQPRIYASVIETLCDQWLRKAQALREEDDDDTAAVAYALEWCQGQLRGLVGL